jgi:hypothetical protein
VFSDMSYSLQDSLLDLEIGSKPGSSRHSRSC